MQRLPKSLNAFHLNGVYPCPVCRQGKISGLTLMEAFSCNLCNHVFSPSLEQQLIKMEDSHIPLTWRWTGRTWKGIRQEGVELGGMTRFAAIAFVGFPPALVGLCAYVFPTAPGDVFRWFPLMWTGLAFLSHLACILWLVIEYYQFPVRLYLYSLGRRLVNQFGF